MANHHEGRRSTELDFSFFYLHPTANNNCPNQGGVEIRTIRATDLQEAKVLAENTPVICENPACGADYQLQK
ncbi:hypothetical protein A3B40_00900 [Candidatus Roizmanbacteria bacterium RIFCSPLOWO2_01_FULL_37_16]|uniref:Uncharacterized protein n=1 Tax=Candidatus Roizmanbacteria bacterium RIFCSPLOWO2_01_FULL_37_16 TaxID=1802058 RepID=A0A1F7IKJ7_9BACT|nr:MAG: hypothetical protein A3B40_00900 [Candidatus Roizmanbacteria bacterium RIFCSPLOWO2_01_FULL_37_16]